MTAIGLRPAFLFFSFDGVNTAASISARKLSNGTTPAIFSNGSPFAEITANRLSASKNPNCPIVSHPRIFVATSQTRINSQTSLFFEVPARRLPNSLVNTSMATTMRFGTGRTTIKRGPGKRLVDGKSFHLADEVRYIQRRAARHDGRVVSIGQLVLFSTETGDAWLLDPSEQLAA